MQSINDFVKGQMEEVRRRNLPSYEGKFSDKYQTTRSLSRRDFMRGAVATIALAATFSFFEVNYARAANAVVYVDSAAAGANNGTSWANAYTTLAAAITASGTTGTDFYVKNTHTESGASLALAFKGVAATPDRVFSCTSTNSPPQTSNLTAGAQQTSSSGGLTVNGYVYIYGIAFSGTATSGGNAMSVATSSTIAGAVFLDGCSIATPTNNTFIFNANGGTSITNSSTWNNTTVNFGGSSCGFIIGTGIFRWLNTASALAGTAPSTMFKSSSAAHYGTVILDAVDISGVGANTIVAAVSTGGTMQFINCRVSASSTLAATPAQPNGTTVDFIITDSTVANSSNYVQTRYMYQGTLTADGSVYNGATDGVNPISWKVVSTANCNPQSPFECFEIDQWVAAGTYASSTVVCTSATGSLTNDDVWVSVTYLGNASYPLGSRVTSGNSPLIPQGSSPANLATGATWGTGGAGTNYTLAVPSFTTNLAGMVRFKVRVGKPSLTVYIDPKVTVA